MLCARIKLGLIGLFASLLLILPNFSHANPVVNCIATPTDPACQGQAAVSATVLSRISPSLSSVVTDLIELPADGVSSVLITVTAINQDGTIAADREIGITSNRGNVELFGVFIENNLQEGNSGYTDEFGVIRFTARSLAPGIATFTIRAENIFLNDKPTITFTPLPVINNVVVSVTVPPLPGRPPRRIIIFQPRPPVPTTPTPIPTPDPTKPAEERLINNQIELQIPFWIFVVIAIILLTTPFVFLWIILLFRKVNLLIAREKSSKEKEESLLNQILALEKHQAQNQQLEIQQNIALSQQILQSNSEIKQALKEEISDLEEPKENSQER